LEEVEVGPVVGELNVHRGTQCLLENLEDVADVLHEWGRVDEAPEVRHQLVAFGIEQQSHRLVEDLVREHREDQIEGGVIGAVLLEQFIQVVGFEGIGLEVDDVHRSG